MKVTFLKAEQNEDTKDWRVDLNIHSTFAEEKMLEFITEKFQSEGYDVNSFGDGMDEVNDTYVTVMGLERCEITETRKELTELYKEFKKEYMALKVKKVVNVVENKEKVTEEQETTSKGKSVKVVNIETGQVEIFPSQSSFHRFLKETFGGAGTDAVRALVNGKRETYKGFKMV